MKKQLVNDIKIIEDALNQYLPEKNNPQSIIYDSMRYSLLAGGKRLRPVLMLETGKMCGGNLSDLIPFACAIEMIHTYSLIHDDLPAMDNDDLRRGMPTNHIKFGESIAILAGDALLNKAFEIVSATNTQNPSLTLRAISILAKSAGTEGMIGGQVVDLESENKMIDSDLLKYLHSLKTGAIIRSSCVIGAVLSGASDEQVKAADDFALNLGIAFQIQDDILDVTGSEKSLGKPIGSDKENNKNTYVTLFGLDKARTLSEKYSKKSIDALNIFGDKAGFLKDMTLYLLNRNV